MQFMPKNESNARRFVHGLKAPGVGIFLTEILGWVLLKGSAPHILRTGLHSDWARRSYRCIDS